MSEVFDETTAEEASVPSVQVAGVASLWCVVASQGEWSDRSEWPVAVFSTEAEAQAYVGKLDDAEREKAVSTPDARRWLYDQTTHYVSEVEDRTAATGGSQ